MNNTFKMNKIFGLVALLLTISFSIKAQAERYTNKSVLSEGNWYKIKISSSGIYKLTYSDLRNMGLSDPSKVKIYGYGGWALEEQFTAPYVDDLPEISIWMSNTPDKFGVNDYVLFYGRGALKVEYSESLREFTHKQNPYSTDAYYFITEADDAPLLMTDAPSAQQGGTTVSTFVDYYLHEKELGSLCSSGRDFFGEDFKTQPTRDFDIDLPGITTGSAKMRINFLSRTKGGRLAITANNIFHSEFKIDTIGNTTYDSYTKAKIKDTVLVVNNFVENNTVRLTYSIYTGNTVKDENVFLDYFRITYDRVLRPYGAMTLFRSNVKNSQLGYQISDASSSLLVFDVTDNRSPQMVNTTLSGTTMTFAASNSTIREYAMVDVSAEIPVPDLVGKVDNQNLHGLENKDMVIIVQPVLQKYAEELKAVHEQEGLSIHIVNPEKIYNEFSSGTPDATAYRRFLKMFYDRAANSSDKPKYLLLFGDGTFDNRFILADMKWTDADKNAMLLTYQSENSINETASYTTDDYFGFLDDKDGLALNKDSVDLGIGRLPAKSEQDASTIVAKIKKYIADSNKGIWKNNICFVADDAVADGNTLSSERQHMYYSEQFADAISKKYPSVIVNRVYCDMYARVKTPNGYRYPDAKNAYLDKINSGVLLLNFMGHGSSRDWTHEYILVNSDIETMTNTNYPLVITASCDFGRFDGLLPSGSETMLHTKAGAIGLITASRVVFSEKNKELNDKILTHIFDKKNGKNIRLGDVVRNAKLDPSLLNDSNKLRFLLLGDPALYLAYPDETYTVKVKKINDTDATGGTAYEMKALSAVKIEGEVVDAQGNVATDFTGMLESVIFDGEQSLKTRGNIKDGTGNSDAQIDYKDFASVIYSGKVNITNGKFTIEYITPKDILYLNKAGKMSFYAYDNENGYQAQGYFTNYVVGGTDNSLQAESNSPEIEEIYLNKPEFESGDQVNTTPVFFAKVKDDSGINLSSGIGHNISLLIDGYNAYNITPYFVNSGTSTKEGTVQFVIPELSEGQHSLQFKVWDVWNNSATANLDFEVVNSYKSSMYTFIVDGNPAVNGTTFKFQTELTASRIQVKYEVYSLAGELLWTDSVNGSSDVEDSFTKTWDLVATGGGKLDAGMYLCRATVSVDGNFKASKSEKLIIQGQ